MHSLGDAEQPEKEDIRYDAVVCVSPAHIQISILSIRSLIQFLQPNRIYVITAKENFDHFKPLTVAPSPVTLIDEDRLIDKISLGTLQGYFLKKTGSSARTGWYFQQFLKMAASTIPELSEHYLIWDSDTIALKKLVFINTNEQVYLNLKREHHESYFETIDNLLKLNKCITGSFISEHLMVKKSYMNELIESIKQTNGNERHWCHQILSAITPGNLNGSGFSEYETYGTFVDHYYPNHFIFIKRKSIRNGTRRFGPIPREKDLLSLMIRENDYATFEVWMKTKARKLYYNKIHSQLTYLLTKSGALFSRTLKQKLTAAYLITIPQLKKSYNLNETPQEQDSD